MSTTTDTKCLIDRFESDQVNQNTQFHKYSSQELLKLLRIIYIVDIRGISSINWQSLSNVWFPQIGLPTLCMGARGQSRFLGYFLIGLNLSSTTDVEHDFSSSKLNVLHLT